MLKEINQRENKLRDFFSLAHDTKLTANDAVMPEITPEIANHLTHFNFEWHVIPSTEVVPFDDNYVNRLYPMRPRDFSHSHHAIDSLRHSLELAHQRHQGKFIAVETTIKPNYLPGNRQFYGTPYGFESTADPFNAYMGRARFTSGTRFNHNYASLKHLGELISSEWRALSVMPKGYRLTICPPVVFNLIGNIFHPEWSETQALELAAYRDDNGNAICFAVGSNARGDFSYVQRIANDSDWTLLGFRAALVPDREV